ncbi:hypothetical protein ECZU18_29900 [Escherichia coli]|nr:hypothetical protein VEGS12_20550 [Escherichia coli]BDZ90089.1 hypothetical protein VEE68_45360 [Escherichia coli]GHK93409.1 hypothetical protein ECZU18_29900 [Escherichia coli]GKM02073.1 hypothetical protein NUKP64_44170 [Klebsiella variicola]
MIIAPAFPFQHDVDSAVAIVDTGFGYLPDAQSQCAVVCRNGAVPERTAADLQRKADLSFTGTVAGL